MVVDPDGCWILVSVLSVIVCVMDDAGLRCVALLCALPCALRSCHAISNCVQVSHHLSFLVLVLRSSLSLCLPLFLAQCMHAKIVRVPLDCPCCPCFFLLVVSLPFTPFAFLFAPFSVLFCLVLSCPALSSLVLSCRHPCPLLVVIFVIAEVG